MARYYDEDEYPRYRRPRHTPLEVAAYLCTIGLILVVFWLAWPALRAQLASAPGREQPVTRPTLPPYWGDPPLDQPAIAPADAIANYNATAEAQYQQAIAPQPTPIPNVDNTGDTAPLERESIVVERQPAPAYAPTAEPIPQPQIDGAFGSKPAPPVDIQATHECKHGQVWTDSGCKNPTPVQ